MDDQTHRLLQQLLDLQRATHATVSGISAELALIQQVILRLVAKTDLMTDLTEEEKELIEKSGAAAMEMVAISDRGESAQRLLELIRRRMAGN